MPLCSYIVLIIGPLPQVAIPSHLFLISSVYIGFSLFCYPVALRVLSTNFIAGFIIFFFSFIYLNFFKLALIITPLFYLLFLLLLLDYKLLDEKSRSRLPRVLEDHYLVKISWLDNGRKLILSS